LSSVRSDAIFAGVTALGESQIFRDLMRFKPESLSANAWAVRAGVSRTVWTDMRRHGNPSRRTLEKLLSAIGSSVAEFEALRLGPEPKQLATAAGQIGDFRQSWTPAPLPPLPLVVSRLGGEWKGAEGSAEVTEVHQRELIDRLPRPPSLAADPEAFALTIVGTAMWPRFRAGARVAVSPRSPVAIGDDVVARLRPSADQPNSGADRALIMHLVNRTGTFFELRQFNPDLTFRVGVADVEAMLKIAGELI
jgi:phage repressor protein C with HTH and peptisase S24 domain